MIRILIVDDEAPARAKLVAYLAEDARFELVGEAVDGEDALDKIERFRPDVLLLDIQMPGMTGFDLLRLLPEAERPRVIFATAYDRYAVEAFSVSAADYLLKPIGRKRFREALDKVAAATPVPSVSEVLSRLPSPTPISRLAVRQMKRIKVLDVSRISRIVAERQIIAVYDREGGRYWTEETLDSLERRLDAERFFRIHRSSLINLDEELSIEPWQDGRLRIHFPDGNVLTAARGPAKELRRRLGF